MLDKIDLSKKISKSDYKPIITDLERRIGELQRQAKDSEIPIIILFEGWDAAGKGTLINRLTLALDPRGFTVYPIHPPNEEERFRPFLWRFWTKIPGRGRIAIFNRNWLGRLLEDRIDKKIKENTLTKAYADVNSMERQLYNDGYLIIKFFLHISKKEQKNRFKNLESNAATAWRVKDIDLAHHKQYERFERLYEEMLAKTSTDVAPWNIIEAHDRRYATLKIFKIVTESIQLKIEEKKQQKKQTQVTSQPVIQLPVLSDSVLSCRSNSVHESGGL